MTFGEHHVYTFGEHHVYKNRQQNLGINKGILEEFRKLTPGDVVWSRSSQMWRQRVLVG